jgi:LysR family glycine cleavage system transcriptional activator|tara:strand:+ start:3147 stop:4073 length:927 start_codon:yes stop_codon:yes gene_type:complete
MRGSHSVLDRLPNLNLLLTFEIAGQLLSFKAAADALHVTPSAVSQQMQQLEDSIGHSLFTRRNRSLELTRDGERLLRLIQPHLSGLRSAISEIRVSQDQQLRVSVMPPVANRVLFPRLADFREVYPNIELLVDTSLSNSNLLSSGIDIAIRFGQPPWPGLAHEKLSDVLIQVVTPVGFCEKYDLPQKILELSKIPLIHMAERPGAWERLFDQLGLPPSEGVAYKVDDYPAAIQAAETLGAALALYPIEQPLLSSGRVEAPFPPIGPIDEAIYAVYAKNRGLSPSGRVFVDWIQSALLALDSQKILNSD